MNDDKVASLSDDELRTVVDEAREWAANTPMRPWWFVGFSDLPLHHLAYAEGVIAERLRQRVEASRRRGVEASRRLPS